MTLSRSLIALAAGLALCAGATAQVVITHAKALAGNVTPGDAPGYPVTISQPGSYILKSNLVVPASVNGIEVATNATGVTLDFNGHVMSAPGNCTSAGPATPANQCSGNTTTTFGIRSYGDHVIVKDGAVMGFGTGALIDGGRVVRMAFMHSMQVGLAQAASSRSLMVKDSQFVLNGSHGVYCDRCDVTDSAALRNGGDGFSGAGVKNMQVTRSSARNNGILGFANLVARDTVAAGNGIGSGRNEIRSAGGNSDDAGIY